MLILSNALAKQSRHKASSSFLCKRRLGKIASTVFLDTLPILPLSFIILLMHFNHKFVFIPRYSVVEVSNGGVETKLAPDIIMPLSEDKSTMHEHSSCKPSTINCGADTLLSHNRINHGADSLLPHNRINHGADTLLPHNRNPGLSNTQIHINPSCNLLDVSSLLFTHQTQGGFC